MAWCVLVIQWSNYSLLCPQMPSPATSRWCNGWGGELSSRQGLTRILYTEFVEGFRLNLRVHFWEMFINQRSIKGNKLSIRKKKVECGKRVVLTRLHSPVHLLSDHITFARMCYQLKRFRWKHWNWEFHFRELENPPFFISNRDFLHLKHSVYRNIMISSGGDDCYSQWCTFDKEFTTLLSVNCKFFRVQFCFSSMKHIFHLISLEFSLLRLVLNIFGWTSTFDILSGRFWCDTVTECSLFNQFLQNDKRIQTSTGLMSAFSWRETNVWDLTSFSCWVCSLRSVVIIFVCKIEKKL